MSDFGHSGGETKKSLRHDRVGGGGLHQEAVDVPVGVTAWRTVGRRAEQHRTAPYVPDDAFEYTEKKK